MDAPPQDTKYAKGLVAMAKAAERAGRHLRKPVLRRHGRRTSDSIRDYAVLGNVTDGLDVVEKIGKLGDPNDPNGAPTERVEIKKMELKSS